MDKAGKLFLILLAASLLPQASLGARPKLAIVNQVDRSDEIQMECRGGAFSGQPLAAIFTLRDVATGMERELNTSCRLAISVFSHNETIARCRIMGESGESDSVAIAGRPQFTAKPNILQYVFSSSTDVVSLPCPLVLPGELFGMSTFTPYEYMWHLKPSMEIIESNEAFTPTANSGALQVHLPSPEPLDDYRFECHAMIRRCNDSSTNSCGPISTTNTMLYDSPPGYQVKIVDLNITVDPPMSQGERKSFTCVAAGFGVFGIKWEVDGMLHDKDICRDMENCSVMDTSGYTSTLELNAEYIRPNTTLTIVCVVTQTLPDKALLENVTTEVRMPSTTSRTRRSATVQLEILNPTAAATATDPIRVQDSNNQLIITAVSIVFALLLLLITILASCVVCIFRYYYKKHYSNLGGKLKHNFPRNATNQPSSSQQIELEHSHGVDSPSINDTDVQVNMGGTVSPVNHPGSTSRSNDGDHIFSDVHIYSRISCVTEYDSIHYMPSRHTRISIDFQKESTGDATVPPSGSTVMPQGDGVSMKENESYRQPTAIHTTRNPAYGTDIAIAPQIDTQENVAYKAT